MKKYSVPKLIKFAPDYRNKKSDEILVDASVRLWREVFPHASAQRFEPRIRHWLTQGRNTFRFNLNSRMKDLMRGMHKAGMPYSDVRALIDDLQVEAAALYYSDDVTAEQIREAVKCEARDNALEDQAAYDLLEKPTPETAKVYDLTGLRANASRAQLILLSRKFSRQQGVA